MTEKEEAIRKFLTLMGKTSAVNVLYTRFIEEKGLHDEFNQWLMDDEFAFKLSEMILKGSIFDPEAEK